MNAVFCLIGPPGSGKGTYSARLIRDLAANWSINHTSVGDELRALQKTLKSGNLSSIEDVELVIDQCISQGYRNDILDGYPRSLEQMELIGRKLKAGQIKSLYLVNLKVDNPGILIHRLTNRRVCSGCGQSSIDHDICESCKLPMLQRNDDQHMYVIRNRINIYYDSYESIYKFCKDNEIPFVEFDTAQGLEIVYPKIRNYFVEKMLKH